MSNLELFKELIKLEKEYRNKYTNNEELSKNDRFILDNNIFPKWWFSTNNYELRIDLLRKALNNNTSLFDVQEINAINRFINNTIINETIKEEKNKELE